jgi:hypothetical protein
MSSWMLATADVAAWLGAQVESADLTASRGF